MSERRILSLKNPPKLPGAAPVSWKCKPCGTVFVPEAADEKGDVRCPHCNARLGPLADFTATPPRPEKLRARMLKPEKPKAPADFVPGKRKGGEAPRPRRPS